MTPDKPRYRPRLKVDCGPRQGARSGQAAEESAGQIGQAFGEALAIEIKLLSGLIRDRLGNRHRFEQAEKRDRQALRSEIFRSNSA